MKKASKIWQRVMALALVLMMVLSYVPTGVVAEGEIIPQEKTAVLLAASLTETANYDAVMWPEEDGNPVTPEVISYTYELKVWNDEKDLQDEVTTTTVINGNSISGGEVYTVPVGTSFEIQVSYQGLELKLSNSEIANGSVEKSIGYTYMDIHKVTQYTAVNLDALKPSDVTGAQWSFVEGADYSTYVTNSVYSANTDNTVIGEYVLTIDKTELAKVPVKVAISAPTYTVALTGADADVWYNTVENSVEVTVTATASATLTVMPENLPDVTADGATFSGWSTQDNTVFTKNISVNKKTIISAGDQSLTVNVDNKVPDITNVDSYVKADNTTVVKFDVAVGESGIKSVMINDVPVTYEENKAVYNGVLGANFKIAVTSKAGLTGTKGENLEPLGKLSVEIKEPAEIIGENNGVKYISAEAEFKIAVNNAHGGNFEAEVRETSISGDPVNVIWNGNVGTFKLNKGQSLNGLYVSLEDETSRGVEAGFATKYAVDDTAPVISIDGLKTTELEYVQEKKTYTVTIEDDAILGEDYSAFYYLDGQTEGVKISLIKDGQKATGSFTLEHGMHLVKIVANATNATGVAAQENVFETNVLVDERNPVITAAVFAVDSNDETVKVSDFYENGDKWFAVLDPVETNSSNGTITLTVTYTLIEDYPDADALTADGWTENDGVWTKVISKTVYENYTGAIDIAVTAKDLAKRVPTEAVTIKGVSENGFVINLKPTNGQYSGTISIDRRASSTESDGTKVPDVTMNPSVETDLTAANGKLLYNAAFNYTFTVTDASAQGQDSGVKSVEWEISENTKDFLSCSGSTTNVNEEITIPVEVIGAGEANDVTLEVTVTDNVGNKFVKVQEFAFDNLAPRVAVSYEDKGACKNENFFNAPRIATITYTDINLNVAQYMVDAQPATDAAVEQVVEYTTDGHHTLGVYAKDLANNEINTFDSTSVAPYDFYIDTQKPVLKIEQTTDATYIGEDGSTDYYNKVVSYTISADDAYMGTAYEGVEGWVKYSKILADGEMVDETVDLLVAEDRKTEFTVSNGETLTNLQVYACDNAGWTTKLDTALKFAETEENSGVYQFERITAVDMTPAEVSLTKTGECVRTMDNVDYYDDVVTYALTITDRYLLNVGTVEVNVDYNGEQEDLILVLNNLNCDDSDKAIKTYTAEFDVQDGSDIVAMTIVLKDNAGNITETINVGEDELTSFEYKDGVNQYTGNRVVVDKTAPEVVITVTESVKSIYTNNGVIYFELNEPAAGVSGIFAGQKEQEAGIIVTVTDKNIALLKTDVENGIKGSVETVREEGEDPDNGKWEGKTKVNEESALTYTESITVKADETGTFTFDLSVFDLANNPIKAEPIVIKDNEGVEYSFAVVNVEGDGTLGATISVDRRRPSSKIDNNAPEITVVAKIKGTKDNYELLKLENDKELYNSAFDFALTVTDGNCDENNAGIREVYWEIIDESAKAKNKNTDNPDKHTCSKDYIIPVTFDGENNDVRLVIKAIDNVGNTINYEKVFAVDNLAPRVTVSYDNNEGWNGTKYFKANRTATIKVEDINFNAGTTAINTEVKPTDWDYDETEGKWICSCSYTADGNYTFAIESTDLAKMYTADDKVTYVGLHPKDFVIDKTAPVITVTYNPSSPVGKDNEGVDYYADELNATVSIREVNFNARDVDAKFNSNNSLSGFSSSGNTHTARETFSEGNRYQFSVNYTDLAGNAAVGYNSPVFSVDLTAPTIEITEGTMTNDKLNIVQEDMVLGFTINDAQSNLKNNYSVKVTHLNNEFKTEEVEGADYYSVTTVEERTTVRVNFANIAAEKGKDGIYTVQITAQDYAGNTVSLTPELLFSLNRFGSTFYTDDPFTQGFLVPSADGAVYQQLVGQKLIFKEINPNQVWQDGNRSEIGSVLTIVVNGTTRILTKDVDYTVSVTKEGVGDTKWYVYTYEVDPAIFADGEGTMDGRYSLLFYSEDEAGNKNTNESNEFGMIQLGLDGEYTGKVEFTLDDTTPIISTVGIESEGSYDAENQKLSIFLSDNTPVSIFVKLNGQSVDLAEAAGANNAAWLIWDDAQACYVLNVPEQNTLFGRQNVEIKVTDAAGNIAEAEIADFTVSSNLFVRFVNSIWFWVVCAALILLVLLIIVLVKRKQKKGIVA